MGDVLRILDRFRITGRGVVYTVKISKGCIIHIGDVLLDLRGNRFEVSGIEMFRGIIAEGKSFEDMPLGLMFKQLDGVEAYGNILVKDLNDINFIFCNHPLYQRKVDEDYEVEYQEAGLHHSCALFSYEDMERGKLSLFGEEISGLTIYRGWMMKPEMYSDFYTLLEQKGIYLINTPEEYERYHTLPGWYDDFADETAQSVWETEGNVENALLKAKQLSGSYIVKDYVKSRKHEWYDACFISNIADVANTASVIKNFVERQGDSLVGGIVLRKFENLKQIGFHERSGMPISEEYRVFVYAGKVLIKLIDWMRVVMTLSRETNYNGGDDYVRAISKGVRKMLPESGDILTYLDKLTDRSGHGFDGDCFDEECLKAKLILRSPEWEKLVIAAEDNKYFNGQIGFLFEISGIDKQFKNACVDKWDAATDQEYRSLFEKYFNIFSSIFGEFTIAGKNDKYVGINRNIANVLRRALLCKGDYTLFHSSNSSFLIDNDRDISWKRLLRIQSNEKNGTYQNRRKMFFSLIKDPLFDQNDIADSLQKICDRDVAGITDWRKYFITVPEIMDSLHKYTDGRASERYVRFEGKYIFLMGSTRLYGWNEEYYSYALYCLLKKLPNASVKYNQAKGWEDVDCHIELTSSTNAGKWKIKYLRAKDKFSVIDASGVQSLYSTVEDAKYALEKLL